MSNQNQTSAFTADEALAIYEDSISYFMPATFEGAPEAEVESEQFVEYSEAA